MALCVEVVENFALTAEGDYAAIAAIGAILQQSLRAVALRTDQCARNKPTVAGTIRLDDDTDGVAVIDRRRSVPITASRPINSRMMECAGGFREVDGGRDRDRTCDPYHVNVQAGEETPEIREFSDKGTSVLGNRLPECSAFPVQRTKEHYLTRSSPAVRQLAQLDPVTIAPDQRATAAKALAYSGALLDMLPARQHGVSVASSSEDGDQC